MKKKTELIEQPPTPKTGRPSKFTPEMERQARFLTARGATDAELAEFFEVSERTLNTWKKVHPEFLLSIKGGKSVADSNVVKALYERAIGYSHPDSHVSNFQGVITVTPITKYYPPDTTACIYWTKNRIPEEWRDRQTVDLKGDALDSFFASLTTKMGLQNDTSGA